MCPGTASEDEPGTLIGHLIDRGLEDAVPMIEQMVSHYRIREKLGEGAVGLCLQSSKIPSEYFSASRWNPENPDVLCPGLKEIL